MKINHRQQKIEEYFFNTDKSILVKAGPGTGKSTTMLYLAKKLGFLDKGVMLAFNNKIVKELKEKLVRNRISNVEATTLHSFGLKLVRQAGIRFKIDDNKYYQLYKIFSKENPDINLMSRKEENIIKFNLKFLDNFSRIFLTNDYIEIKKSSIELGVWEIKEDKILKQYWETSFLEIRKEFNNRSYKIMDFTDMLYYPVLFNLKCNEGFTHVFADECQDFSVLQHRLFQIICEDNQHQKFIAVGDDRQAINAFAGSSANSFELFKSYNNVIELPLDITYRCPPIITDELSKIYEGVIPFKKSGGSLKVKTEDDLINIPQKSLILCRNTAPLIQTSFMLAALNKKCYILGKDSLNTTKRVLRDYMDYNIFKALMEANNELTKVSQEMNNEASRIRFYLLKDALDIVASLKNNFKFPMGTKLRSYFYKASELFTPTPESIVLSTIHKSKGLENDNVYLINKKQFMPSKMARGEKAKIQEKNLFFVAMSRSSENFNYLNIKFEEG